MSSKDYLMVPWATGLTYFGDLDQRVAAGSLLAYARYGPGSGFSDESVAWRPNEVFSGTLRLAGVDRTSPGTHRCIWRSDDGRTYPMFTVDLVDMIMTRGIGKGGLVHERWTVRRAGRNFGLVLAK